jgi:glycosyltransferase involved in cell wall biosynthesis
MGEGLGGEAAAYDLWLRLAGRRAVLSVIGRVVARAGVRDWGVEGELGGVRERFLRGRSQKAEDRRQKDEEVGRAHHTVGEEGRGGGGSAAKKGALRVGFVNDHGFKYGAGIAHGRLAAAVALGGHEIVAVGLSEDQPYDAAGGAVTTEGVIETIRATNPDVVVMGNVHSAAADGRVVGAIAREFPTAFVLHDIWMLTGRCAYSGSCERHLSSAGCHEECPTWREYPRLEPDRVHEAWQFKRDLLHAGHAPVLLANSGWMLELARRVLAVPNEHVLHSRPARSAMMRLAFPVGRFTPRDKRACREKLGLPQDRFLLLFSASSLDDRRKGVAHLVDAMKLLNLPDVTCVCVGRYDAGAKPPLPDLRVMGYMNDIDELATLYSAVDLFVGPSLEEALGQVYVEAAACGTPSVGYPVGGVPEAVVDGVTGRIASAVKPAALAVAIKDLYDNAELREEMGRWGRVVAENEWSEVTALHRWHTALRETGLGDRVGLSYGIRIVAGRKELPEVEFVTPENPSWRAVSGWGPWEGPYPQWDLPRVRWGFGPGSVLEVRAAEEGRYRLMVECFNREQGQKLSVVRDGECVGTRAVPGTAAGVPHVAWFDLTLRRGWNRLELQYERWHLTEGTKRKQAVLVSRVVCRRWEG